MTPLDIGIAYELKSDFAVPDAAPVDALEEYDSVSTIEAICDALRALGHRPRMIGGGRAFLQTMLGGPPQLVFNNSEGHGSRSREAQVPAICEMLGVPCTHSDPLTLALTLDKAMTKHVVRSAGVHTAPFAVASSLEEAEAIDLDFPVFVKPVAEGSSMGVRVSSRVNDRESLIREIGRCLRDYKQSVLVETFLPGVEVTVGVCGEGRAARVMGSMEIFPAEGTVDQFVYGLESKHDYQRLVRYAAPPRSPSPAQVSDAEQAALAAYRALGCRDIARADLRFDDAGRAALIEVNPLPGLNPITGDIVVMTRLLGRSYEDLIAGIVEAALRRYPQLNS